MDQVQETRRDVWLSRSEGVGLVVVVAVSLGWLSLGCIAWIDGLLEGLVEIVAAFATPAQWLLPLAGVGLLLQVLPRVLATARPARDRGSWRVMWSAVFLTLLAVLFFGSGWVALFDEAFSGSLYNSVGNLFFYWSFAVAAGGLAALGWFSTGLYHRPDRDS